MPDPRPSRRSPLLLRRAPAAVLLAALLFAGPGVRAASPTLPTRGPSVSGSITGDLVRGGFATLRISASDPRGWREIDLMQITMLLNGQPLGQINFVPALGTVTMLGGNLVQVGADNSLTGGFFRFTGLDVTEVTGGTRVAFSVSAHVVQAVPAATKFELAAMDQAGTTASVLVVAKATGGRKGFSWGTLATAVVAALFVGSLVGGLFGSKRRPAPRTSVYSAVQRRIEEERARS